MKRYKSLYKESHNILGYPKMYETAINKVLTNVNRKLHVTTHNVFFYTYITAPNKLVEEAVEEYRTTPPAIVFPSELCIIMKPEFYKNISNFMHVVGHEIGHLLDYHFAKKLNIRELSKKYNLQQKLTRHFKNIIIPSIVDSSESIANIFSYYILDQPLEPRELSFINEIINLI